MSLFIAIDGGGTKTQVICATETREVLGEGTSGPASLAVSTPEVAKDNVQQALTQALSSVPQPQEVTAVALGLAGVNTPVQIEAARALFTPLFTSFNVTPDKITVVNDVEIALANGSTAPNAIALIAGTGSNCWGHNQAGNTAKAGGVDYLLSDEGSGYALGIAALKGATKSADGRTPHSLLQELVFQHFAVNDLIQLQDKVYSPPLTKTQIAQLSPVVQSASEQGDVAAQEIIRQAVTEWVLAVTAVATRLQLESTPTDLVLAGSLTGIPLFYDQFAPQISQRFPQMKLIRPETPPVFGALALALQRLKA